MYYFPFFHFENLSGLALAISGSQTMLCGASVAPRLKVWRQRGARAVAPAWRQGVAPAWRQCGATEETNAFWQSPVAPAWRQRALRGASVAPGLFCKSIPSVLEVRQWPPADLGLRIFHLTPNVFTSSARSPVVSLCVFRLSESVWASDHQMSWDLLFHPADYAEQRAASARRSAISRALHY